MGSFHRPERPAHRRAPRAAFHRDIDPDVFFGTPHGTPGRPARADHKTRALCKQVHHALSLALAGECADQRLQALTVLQVQPAPNAGRLLATLGARPPADLPDLLVRLEAVRGLLRARVAEAITRKRAPDLTFTVLPLPGIPLPEDAPDA